MERLLNGALEFRDTDFQAHKDLFKTLGNEQNPHTLFIGCSDSRVDPTMITNTFPGEIFVIRNIANIVPKYRISEEFLATTSAIEYAVKVLNVENIVVCGHSNCGGCNALYLPDEKLDNIPHTKKWLELAKTAKEKVLEIIPNRDDIPAREWMTEQANVLEQLKHLFSYPFVKEKFQEGKLKIYGWHYIIETGEILCYSKEKGYFELIN
ncbi:MAG: carbonic anhydrase [Lentisphaerota bacterium]